MSVALAPMTYEETLSRLRGVQRTSDTSATALCPGHEDNRSSLSVSIGENRKVLLHCHAGCTFPTIVHGMGSTVHEFTGGMNNPNRAYGKRSSSKPKGEIVKTYDYCDESGELLFQVCRMQPKDFRQRQPNGSGGWNWSTKNVRKVPYRLPELLKADPAEVIFIPEGEKDVDRLVSLGLQATCNAGGAGKWKFKSDALEVFRGRSVAIPPDNDDVGQEHAQSVARSLEGIASEIRIVALPDLPPKGDVSDYLNAGGTAESLKELVSTTPLWDPASAPETKQKTPPDKPNETVDDPHRLAREFRKTRYLNHVDENTLAYRDDEFHRHDGVRYRSLPTAEIRAELTAFIKQEFDAENLHLLAHPELWDSDEAPRCRKVTTGLVNNAMAALTGLAIVPKSIDVPGWISGGSWGSPDDILATRSGLLDLRRALIEADCLHVPTARFFTPNGVDYAFDPQAGCPNWLQFLQSVWPDDHESIALLQQWFGYLLTNDTQHHKLLMLIGPPRSGKGTIARAIKGVIGAGNISSPTLGSLAGPFGLWPLYGRTAAIIADARLSGRTDAIAVVERLLSISGEDPQDIHRKNMPTLCGVKLPVRFTLMSNELPNLRDASGALTSRVMLLRMMRSFLGSEDKRLGERIDSEYPGILNWALIGLHQLRERGAFIQPQSGRELLDDLEDLASPITQFVRECCNVGPEATTPVDAAFACWKRWCEQHGRDHIGTKEVFGKDLRSALPQIRKSEPRTDFGRVKTYEGIGIKLEWR